MIMNIVDCSDISDICGTSTSNSITQDDNMVHKSVSDNDSSDCEQENVIIKWHRNKEDKMSNQVEKWVWFIIFWCLWVYGK